MTNKNNQCDAAVNYGSIQQLNKKEDGKERKPIFPVTPIQAVYDARTGASLEAILAQFNSIYVQYQGTSEATRNIIPEVMRRAGLKISYKDMEGTTIEEQCRDDKDKFSDAFGNDENWIRYDNLLENIEKTYYIALERVVAVIDKLKEGVTPDMLSESVKQLLAEAGATITNLPDEEDITTTGGTVPMLKFKDKEYLPEMASGLGRIYLRKNFVGGKNILTQEMISKPNTIYIIQYDFDLNGAEITIPEGCTLDFQGGSFSNGTIFGSGTNIKDPHINSFYQCLFSGNFFSKYKNARWGAGINCIKTNVVSIDCYKLDNEEDYTEALERWVLDTTQDGTSLYIPEGLYDISRTVSLIPGKYYKIYGNSISSIIQYKGEGSLFEFNGSETDWIELYFSSLKFIGNYNSSLFVSIEHVYNRCTYTTNCVFERWNTVFDINNAYNTKICQCRFFDSYYPLILRNANGSSIVNNTFLYNIRAAININNDSNYKSVYNVNISGNTIEGYSEDGLILSSNHMVSINVSHNYFEPSNESANIIRINKEQNEDDCELTNSTFIGNYGRYSSFVILDSKISFCSFISNAFSIKFKSSAIVKSLMLTNHRFDSYYFEGLTENIRKEIILLSTSQSLNKTGIYNPNEQLVPITIPFASVAINAGESKIVGTVNSGILFELYNFQANAAYGKFKVELIDNNNSVIYTIISTDPIVSYLKSPIFRKVWEDNTVHDISVKVSNTHSSDTIWFSGYITYCNKRYK